MPSQETNRGQALLFLVTLWCQWLGFWGICGLCEMEEPGSTASWPTIPAQVTLKPSLSAGPLLEQTKKLREKNKLSQFSPILQLFSPRTDEAGALGRARLKTGQVRPRSRLPLDVGPGHSALSRSAGSAAGPAHQEHSKHQLPGAGKENSLVGSFPTPQQGWRHPGKPAGLHPELTESQQQGTTRRKCCFRTRFFCPNNDGLNSKCSDGAKGMT